MFTQKMNSSRILFLMGVLLCFVFLACGERATPTLVEQSDQQPPERKVVEMPPPETPAPVVGATQTDTATPPPASPTPAGPQIFAVGDMVSIGDCVLVVLGWEEVPPGDFAEPDEGNKFVAVELIVVNQSVTPISVSSMLQMSLKDETAQQFDVDFMAGAALKDAGVDGELSPGERIRGKVGFQAPQNATGLQFVFDESLFGQGKVFVDLGPAPVKVEPPAEIAGETQQQIFAVGDVVSIGDSVLMVLGWEEVPGDNFAKPDEGYKFMAVEVLVVNQSDRAASISSMLQISLKDVTGQAYEPDFRATTALDSDGPDGELAPGERIRGKVGFQVPQTVAGLQFVFDADVFGAGKVFVDLPAQPIQVEPPVAIAGETAQTTFNLGDAVEIGSLILTVNDVTSPPGNEFNQPDEGQKFVVVDLTLENRGSEAENISSLLQMSLKDATGQSYDPDLMASAMAGGSMPDGELAPGEKVRGQVGFQTPLDASGLVFVFDADVFGAGKVFVALP